MLASRRRSANAAINSNDPGSQLPVVCFSEIVRIPAADGFLASYSSSRS